LKLKLCRYRDQGSTEIESVDANRAANEGKKCTEVIEDGMTALADLLYSSIHHKLCVEFSSFRDLSSLLIPMISAHASGYYSLSSDNFLPLSSDTTIIHYY
jgi:hypothetical protein